MFLSLHCGNARLGRALYPLLLVVSLMAPIGASATEPSRILVNKNAQALPLGVTFHPDLPYSIRKAIIEDLSWLSTRGRIEDERLRHLLQIESPMTGDSLVAWFLDRIHVIGLFGWCARTDFVTIRFNNAGFVITRPGGRCSPLPPDAYAVAGGALFNRLQAQESAQAILVGRNVRIVPESWPDGFAWPIMLVSSSFLNGGSSIPARVQRLGALLHEASHIEGTAHGMCKLDDWKLAVFALGPFTFPSLFRLGDRYCDDPNANSVVTIEASFLRAMAEACGCSPAERGAIKFSEWSAWRYQAVPLKEALVVPLDGDLSGINALGGKTLRTFPPAEFIEAGLKYTESFLQACQNKCSSAEKVGHWRSQLVALREFGNDLKGRGAFVASWESSNPKRPPIKRPLNIDGAKQWLAAAAQAAGYNVETMSLVSCADLQDQC